MTIREKLNALKKVQDYQSEIAKLLKEIIRYTTDYHCDGINNFTIEGKCVCVNYSWYCRGYSDNSYVSIPIEWLDEGFDYKGAYQEEMRKAQEKAKRNGKRRKERLKPDKEREKKRKEKEEYKKYLKLKRKYEVTHG